MRVALEDALALTALREIRGADAAAAPPMATESADALVDHARRHCADDPRRARLWRARAWLTGRHPGPWLAAAALLVGIAGPGLAAGDALNVLAPPLLGFLLWQFAVYGLLGARTLRAPRPAKLPTLLGDRLPTRLAGLEGDEARAFSTRWLALAGNAVTARWAATLHLAAAALALGAVLGLYVDGLATAYTARWESTFLGPAQVAQIVGFVLGPAAALTGIEIPDRAGFAAMAEAGLPAAPWIHLWATTLIATTVVPRLVLAALAQRRVSGAVDIAEDGWLRQQQALLAGRRLTVAVQPLGYRPDPRSHERLAEALTERFGAQVIEARRPPLPWDADPRVTGAADEDTIVMVSAAQTPEEEVHGPLLDALAGDRTLLLAVDAQAYAADADRRASRLAAWQRLAAAHGAEVLALEAQP